MIGVQFVAGVVAMLRAFASIERSIDSRFSEIKLAMNTFKEGDIRDLHGRLTRLETGSDEWTRALRTRTHEHANEINELKLKMDRLERPGHYQPPHPGTT